MKKYTFLLSALCCSLSYTMDFQSETKLKRSESYDLLEDALLPYNQEDSREEKTQSDNLLTHASYLRLCEISNKKISIPKRGGSPRKRRNSESGYETEQEENLSPRLRLRDKIARGLSDPKKFIKAQ